MVKSIEPKGLKPKILQPHSMVCIIEYTMKSIKDQKEMLFLLASDLHMDHPKCNRELLKAHFDECVERGGHILLNGDIFCVMQGRNDKRHNKGSVRPENMKDNYFDSVVDSAVEFLLPYAKHILFIGAGNHETAIYKRVEIDLLRQLTEKIYLITGHRIVLGEYHGWIYIKCIMAYTRERRKQMTLSYTIYHNHGTGGEAPVTGGSIEDHRKQTQVEGADAIWQGHNHNKYSRQVAVHYFDRNVHSLKPKFRIIEVIRTGTYKQEYTGHGWHIETNKAPKPLGGIWLTLKPVISGHKGLFFLAPAITKTWHQEIEIDNNYE
jgi:hypothetical protein